MSGMTNVCVTNVVQSTIPHKGSEGESGFGKRHLPQQGHRLSCGALQAEGKDLHQPRKNINKRKNHLNHQYHYQQKPLSSQPSLSALGLLFSQFDHESVICPHIKSIIKYQQKEQSQKQMPSLTRRACMFVQSCQGRSPSSARRRSSTPLFAFSQPGVFWFLSLSVFVFVFVWPCTI